MNHISHFAVAVILGVSLASCVTRPTNDEVNHFAQRKYIPPHKNDTYEFSKFVIRSEESKTNPSDSDEDLAVYYGFKGDFIARLKKDCFIRAEDERKGYLPSCATAPSEVSSTGSSGAVSDTAGSLRKKGSEVIVRGAEVVTRLERNLATTSWRQVK